MYNDELDMVLEDAYDDGYVQALLDMDVDIDDIAEEDVDIFDDNYFGEAMEGPAREYRHKQNAGKTPEEIHKERKITLNMLEDPRFSTKHTARGRHFRHFHPEMKEELIKERDDEVHKYDTEDGYSIRSDVDRKYGKKAEKKVRDDYNARTRAQYDALKSKLQSSNLTAAQKRAAMEKFKARKMQEKRAVDLRALSTKHDAWDRARDLHWKQLRRRKGFDKFLKEDE